METADAPSLSIIGTCCALAPEASATPGDDGQQDGSSRPGPTAAAPGS